MGYIQPSLRLALCEMASNSLPALRCASIHFHRSSGWAESSALYGISGTLAQSLKKMLRCRLRLLGIEVHSYEQNAVNLPGWLFSSAILTFSFQMVPATCGAHEGFHRSSGHQVHEVGEGLLNVRLVIRVLENERLRLGQLAHGRSRRVRFFRYADVFRVVGHAHEVHGRVDLDVVAQAGA